MRHNFVECRRLLRVSKFQQYSMLQANRDAGIREAECEKAAMDVKYSTGEQVDQLMTTKIFTLF